MTTPTERAGDVLEFAEQATLGSLLLTPEAVPTVARWLRPSDFIDPWHRHVYAALLDHQPTPVTAMDLGRDMLRRLGPRRADLLRIHALLSVTPDHPRPVQYARMVLESGIRQQTQALGVLIRAGARLASTTGNTQALHDGAHLVRAVIDADLTRWGLSTDTSNSPAAVPPDRTPEPARLGEIAPVVIPDWRPLALGADRALTAHPALDPTQVRRHERTLIAALIAHPQALAHVSWLRPEMLTDRHWRTAYIALLQLTDQAVPIDTLTLAWEIHRASSQHGPGPSLADLHAETEHGRSQDPRFAAIAVAADTLDRLAGHAVASIRTAATNPGVDVRDVLGNARLMTTTLTDVATAMPRPVVDRTTTALRPAVGQATGHHQRSAAARPDTPPLRVVR